MAKKRLITALMLLSSASFAAGLTDTQRIERIENQMNFLTQVNQEVTQLQETVLGLNGQIEVLTKALENLKASQTEINEKMTQAKTAQPVQAAAEPFTQVAPAPLASNADQIAYQAAFDLVTQSDHDDALNAMNQFIKDYPNSTYQAGAHYWLGELYAIEGKPEEAIAEFQWVLHAKSDSLYAPEAAFKLGMIYVLKKDTENAKKMFNKVLNDFPKTKAAINAKVKLRALT